MRINVQLFFSMTDLTGEKRSSEDDGTADNSVKRQKLAGSQNNSKRVKIKDQLSAHSPKFSLVTLNLTMVTRDTHTHTPCLTFRDNHTVTPLEFKTNRS